RRSSDLGVTAEMLTKRRVVLPGRSAADDFRDGRDVGERGRSRQLGDRRPERRCPFLLGQLAKSAPRFAPRDHLVFRDGVDPVFGTKATLPALAAHHDHPTRAVESRVDADHVDVAVHGVLASVVLRVIAGRAELDVVPGEVPFVLQVLVHHLFEDVFFHSCSPSRSIIRWLENPSNSGWRRHCRNASSRLSTWMPSTASRMKFTRSVCSLIQPGTFVSFRPATPMRSPCLINEAARVLFALPEL